MFSARGCTLLCPSDVNAFRIVGCRARGNTDWWCFATSYTWCGVSNAPDTAGGRRVLCTLFLCMNTTMVFVSRMVERDSSVHQPRSRPSSYNSKLVCGRSCAHVCTFLYDGDDDPSSSSLLSCEAASWCCERWGHQMALPMFFQVRTSSFVLKLFLSRYSLGRAFSFLPRAACFTQISKIVSHSHSNYLNIYIVKLHNF